MKAIINAQSLAKELKKVSPIIKKTSVLPILSCVKLSFDKGKVMVTATDLETMIIATIDCECKSPFSIVIEFSGLLSICSKIFELITIEEREKEITIVSDNSKFKFAKINDAHFPKVHEDEFTLNVEVDSDFFISLYNANACRSDDQLKVSMNAACVHLKKDNLTIVGTDAYVAFKRDLKMEVEREAQVMVDENFVMAVKNFDKAVVSMGEKFIKVTSGDVIVISRLLDAKYCKYEVIMPKEIEYNLKADRGDMIKSLEVAGVAASPTTHYCSINFNGGDIKIISKDIDFGKEGESRLDAEHSVPIKAIGINGHQMLKLLNMFDSKEIEMSFRGEGDIIYMRPLGEPNTLCLLQPLTLTI